MYYGFHIQIGHNYAHLLTQCVKTTQLREKSQESDEDLSSMFNKCES